MWPAGAKSPTVPGTDTKVTPEREVPIMPKATSIQLELLLPMKKDSLLELREVNQATASSSTKYPITNPNSSVGDIGLDFCEREDIKRNGAAQGLKGYL